MLERNIALLLVLAAGVLGQNKLVAAGAGILLALDFSGLSGISDFLEKRGLEIGLIFLTVAVIAPLRAGTVRPDTISGIFSGLPAVAGLLGGVLATVINKKGVELLQSDPNVIVAILVGTLIGCTVLRGIPVGPLTASGIAALVTEVCCLLGRGAKP
ncbi:MAG: DUF441 domain-containing protein [Firmicutes bacterium]|jgi:uncharacterized membrane protein (DUF441 family)|nr:DUF441 domain-containing protein [Bacillota bacterium]